MSTEATELQNYLLNVYPSFCSPTPYFEGFEFFQLVLNTLTPFLIIIGVYGILVILISTPLEMKSAKWTLLIAHVSSFYLGFVSTVLTRPFIYSPSVAIYATGILLKIGVPFKFAMWIGQTSYPIQEISLVILSENRYSQISSNPKFIMNTRTRATFFALHYVTFPAVYIIQLFTSPDSNSAKLEILRTIPCPEHHFFLEETQVATTNTRRQSLITAFQSIYLFGLAFIFAFCCAHCLLKSDSVISKNTRDMQKKFLIALTIQVMVPFVILFIPFVLYWSSMMVGVVLPIIRSLNIFCIALHGIVSGILLVLLHKPYREFTFYSLPVWINGRWKVQPRRTSIASVVVAVN